MTKHLLATSVAIAICILDNGFCKDPDPSWANQKGITAGTLVKRSMSPDGKLALFEFFYWDGDTPDTAMTSSGIGLAPLDRSKLLFDIGSRTKWQTDKEVPTFLTFLWNPDSTLLAAHDSLDKHSKLNVFRVTKAGVTSLDIPDLLKIASAKLGIDSSTVSASGQLPSRWIQARALEVTVRMTSPRGKHVTKLMLDFHDDGSVSAR
jgi:hypothetical protein